MLTSFFFFEGYFFKLIVVYVNLRFITCLCAKDHDDLLVGCCVNEEHTYTLAIAMLVSSRIGEFDRIGLLIYLKAISQKTHPFANLRRLLRSSVRPGEGYILL